MKIKSITTSILALSIASTYTSYAADTNNDNVTNANENTSVQAQIAELKAQIATLEKNQQSLSSGQTTVKEKNPDQKGVTQQGSLSLLELDNAKGSVPFGLMPSSQYPLALLQARNDYGDNALIFGGYIESDTQGWWGDDMPAYEGTDTLNKVSYKSGYGTYITTGRMYAVSNLGKYVQANLTLEGSQSTDVFVKEAFVTFGNLETTPFYATVGKTRMSLGTFNGGAPWVGGLTQMLFRPGYESNVTLGYAKDNFVANLSLFNGESDTSTNALYSMAYGNNIGKFQYSGIVGYVYNWQGTGMGALNQSSSVTGSNKIPENDRNSVINFDGKLGYNNYGLSGGYATTTFSKAYTNDTRASAWYLQGTYSTPVFNRETAFSISYNRAYNTQNLAVQLGGDAKDGYNVMGVRELYTASVQRPFFTDNVLVGLEYGRMITYSNLASNEVTLDLSVYI